MNEMRRNDDNQGTTAGPKNLIILRSRQTVPSVASFIRSFSTAAYHTAG
jgi:hypothetical protein